MNCDPTRYSVTEPAIAMRSTQKRKKSLQVNNDVWEKYTNSLFGHAMFGDQHHTACQCGRC